MYAGHAGLALVGKARRPRLSLALLVIVAFAPDWIEWLLHAKAESNPTAVLISHSIPSVVAGAALVGGVYWLFTRRGADAAMLGAVYLSHWAADFITGRKPTWPGGPIVGLSVYRSPAVDFFLECALVVVCSAIYLRSVPGVGRRKLVAVLVPMSLVVLQGAFVVLMHKMP